MAKAKGMGVLGLALANVKKSDGDKAADAVKRAVRANQNDWRNSHFAAEQALDNANESVEALQADPNTSVQQMLDAVRNAALCQKNLEDIAALAEARFVDAN